MKIEIDKPKALPGDFMLAVNYRSKRTPTVLVLVQSVNSGWDKNGICKHSYDVLRLNTTDTHLHHGYLIQYDFLLGKRGSVIKLIVTDDQIFTLTPENPLPHLSEGEKENYYENRGN